MIQSFFHKLLLRRHFWRYATFGEVAELYASRMLRMAALYMAGAFMAIYLFQIGYSIAQIALFWAGFYLFKVVAALPSAAVVGKIGPKHAIMVSNLLYIPAMIGFVLLPAVGPWMLLPVLVLEGLSAGMYSIAYTIDFSKVKSMEHAGKEIAYMNMIEKLTVAISPVIGGALAFFFGPQVVIALAAVLFALAAVPLFKTGEPVKTGEKLQFKGFPWRLLMRHWLAQISVGFDVFASGTVWTLFVAVFIIGIATDNQVYAVMGLLLSVVFIAALFASYVYGKIIDRRQGKQLMRLASVANFATHLVRPFIASPVGVAGLNATNEVVTAGYTMPYTRAVFDNADLSGARTTYLGLVELLANVGAFLAASAVAVLAFFFEDQTALSVFYFLAAGSALLILTARFPLYK